MDPDCCLQSSCQNQPYCRGLPDPQDIISQSQQSPSQQAAKSFYDRISFLIGPDSTHVIPGESPFNKRWLHPSCTKCEVICCLLAVLAARHFCNWITAKSKFSCAVCLTIARLILTELPTDHTTALHSPYTVCGGWAVRGHSIKDYKSSLTQLIRVSTVGGVSKWWKRLQREGSDALLKLSSVNNINYELM